LNQLRSKALDPPRAGRGSTSRIVGADKIERRLHDLTLDFGIITAQTLSRPLQFKELGSWGLKLWVPRRLFRAERSALQALDRGELPIAMARKMPPFDPAIMGRCRPQLACESYVEALVATQHC
jgi:hypothetical protein